MLIPTTYSNLNRLPNGHSVNRYMGTHWVSHCVGLGDKGTSLGQQGGSVLQERNQLMQRG